tara:strand:- start:247 stop:1638 length:1392 start_codon:yes stop_codon:yes gene_type:complete
MARFRFNKDEVKYNNFIKDQKETEVRDSILSSGVVDTIRQETVPINTIISEKDKNKLDGRIVDSLTETFYNNIQQDAARTTIKDYDLISQVIKDDPGLSSFYNTYNSLKNEIELKTKELDDFTYTHEDLWYHGYEDNKITLGEYKNKREEYSAKGTDLKAQAQKKFDYIMTVLTDPDTGNTTAARWFYKMYNNAGGTIFPDQNLFGNPEIHEKMMGNKPFSVFNPFSWDLWDPRKWDHDMHHGITNIMGPSINRETGELQYKNTFMTDTKPGGEIARGHYEYVYRNMDPATQRVYKDFMMLFGDYEKTTEDFNNFNQMMGNAGNEGLQIDIPEIDYSGGYGSIYFAALHDKEGVDISGGTLTIEPSQKNIAYKLAQEREEIVKQINKIKNDANNYITNALDLEIDKNALSMGLLYTFDELLDEMDKSYEKTKKYYVDEIGLDPKLVDLWYQNIKQGNFSDINR